MTMPALMNCLHSGEGWCLACVAKLHEKIAELEKKAYPLLPFPAIKATKRVRAAVAINMKGQYAVSGWSVIGNSSVCKNLAASSKD